MVEVDVSWCPIFFVKASSSNSYSSFLALFIRKNVKLKTGHGKKGIVTVAEGSLSVEIPWHGNGTYVFPNILKIYGLIRIVDHEDGRRQTSIPYYECFKKPEGSRKSCLRFVKHGTNVKRNSSRQSFSRVQAGVSTGATGSHDECRVVAERRLSTAVATRRRPRLRAPPPEASEWFPSVLRLPLRSAVWWGK